MEGPHRRSKRRRLRGGSLRNIADYVFTEYMAKCIYPDLFADLDPEAEMHDLYATYLPELRYTGTFMIQWDRQ